MASLTLPKTSPLPPPQWLSPHTLIPPLNTSAGLSYSKLKNSLSFALEVLSSIKLTIDDLKID